MIDDELRAMLDRIVSLEARMDKVDAGEPVVGKTKIHLIEDTDMCNTGARTLLFMTKDGYDFIMRDHSFCPAAEYIIGWVDDDERKEFGTDDNKIPINTNTNHDTSDIIRATGKVAHKDFDSVPLNKYYAFMYIEDILDALFGKHEDC